jgi:hypothetical protein
MCVPTSTEVFFFFLFAHLAIAFLYAFFFSSSSSVCRGFATPFIPFFLHDRDIYFLCLFFYFTSIWSLHARWHGFHVFQAYLVMLARCVEKGMCVCTRSGDPRKRLMCKRG